MRKNESIPQIKKLKRIQPRYVVIISIFLLPTLFISALLELTHTRREIQHVMEEEATTLVEAISASGANAIYSIQEIETLIEEKLLSIARLIDRLEFNNNLTSNKLLDIANENNLNQIFILDTRGKITGSSDPNSEKNNTQYFQAVADFQKILDGQNKKLVIGYVSEKDQNSKLFGVAVKRSRGGAIVVDIDADEILEFKKSIGVGRLMQDISDYKGIDYIVLQDIEGIILASSGITRMQSIESDPFLLTAYTENSKSFRMLEMDDREVFEFVQPFILYGEPVGLFRIGVKTDHLVQANNRIKRRLIIMSIIMGLFIITAVNLLMVNQNYRIVHTAYQRIQTYSKNILENMTDAVIAIDKDRCITIFNRAASKLFKVHAKQVLEKPCDTVLSADITPLIQTLETGETVDDEEKIIHLENRRLITSINTSVLKNSKGEIDSAFAIIKDQTEKHALEENLRRKEKLTAMGQLASGVAHEIRNPLNAIGMISQRLDKEFEPNQDSEEFHELTKIISAESRRIDTIIQQFLKFARPAKLNLERTNLNELIESTVLLLKSQAEQQNVEITTHLLLQPQLLLDKNQMKQALLNLIRNSLEAVQEKGSIEVRTSLTEFKNEIILEISDTGEGIDRETLPKIFNLYFTSKPKGTGLGLSLVHKIISQHNGRIEVDSEVGKGTTFYIYLPV